MNPLVEEMLIAKSRQDLEIAMLEELLHGDAKCESTHYHEMPPCSGAVVARKRTDCDNKDFKICHNSYEWNMRAVSGGITCATCKEPCAECWTITPI